MNLIKKILGLDKQNEKLDTITSLTIKLLDNENLINDKLQSNFRQLNQKIENNHQFSEEVKQANQKNESEKVVVQLEQFRMNLIRKQEFLIEDAELYEVLQ